MCTESWNGRLGRRHEGAASSTEGMRAAMPPSSYRIASVDGAARPSTDSSDLELGFLAMPREDECSVHSRSHGAPSLPGAQAVALSVHAILSSRTDTEADREPGRQLAWSALGDGVVLSQKF